MTHPITSSLPAKPRPLLQEQRGHRPSGPPWHTAAQNTFRFSRKTLDFLLQMRERYGDLVTLPTILGPWTLVFHPDGVRHVVQENHFNYRKESMRLYPPAWAFARYAIAEDEIAGYTIAKGAYVLMFPSMTHRHPDFWERPDVFDPERFTPCGHEAAC
jgi:Cytochrome P450